MLIIIFIINQNKINFFIAARNCPRSGQSLRFIKPEVYLNEIKIHRYTGSLCRSTNLKVKTFRSFDVYYGTNVVLVYVCGIQLLQEENRSHGMPEIESYLFFRPTVSYQIYQKNMPTLFIVPVSIVLV